MIRNTVQKRRIAKFQAKLLRRRAQLEEEVAEYLVTFRQAPSDHLCESGDLAVDALGEHELVQVAQMRSLELGQIEQALQRITHRDFGICENCGRKIGLARLATIPSAPYCTACQREFESQAAYEVPEPENWEGVTDPE